MRQEKDMSNFFGMGIEFPVTSYMGSDMLP